MTVEAMQTLGARGRQLAPKARVVQEHRLIDPRDDLADRRRGVHLLLPHPCPELILQLAGQVLGLAMRQQQR